MSDRPRLLSAALALWAALASCGDFVEAPEPPAAEAGRAKAEDGPTDAARRRTFLSGNSAAEAAALVATNNPKHIDAVAAFFADPAKPYSQRLASLLALRSLRTQDAGEYARVFPQVRPKLWEEVSHAAGLGMSPENEKGFIEAIGWLSDRRDPEARLSLELHLDRETVKRKRLSDPALSAIALALAAYPDNESARDTLWAALRDPKESALVRASCLKALKAFYPKDLEARIVQIDPAPGDDWLKDQQRRYR